MTGHDERLQPGGVRDGFGVRDPVEDAPVLVRGRSTHARTIGGDEPNAERRGQGVVGMLAEARVAGAVLEEHGHAVRCADDLVRQLPITDLDGLHDLLLSDWRIAPRASGRRPHTSNRTYSRGSGCEAMGQSERVYVFTTTPVANFRVSASAKTCFWRDSG